MNQTKLTSNKENVFWLTGVFFFVLLGAGVASIYFLVQLNSELKQIVKEDIPITDMIAEITIHKLEQTSWFERALRHAEIVAHKRENNEDNLRLFGEAKDKFEKIAVKVNEEIDNTARMSSEAQKLAHTEHRRTELKHIEEFLISIQRDYAAYNERATELFALFQSGKIAEAEKLIDVTEKLEADFNQRLEEFLFESDEFTRHSLSSIGESEGKAIIIIAVIISISLLFTAAVLLFKVIFAIFRKVHPSRDWR